MPEPLSFLTFGSTGLVGSHFVDVLLKASSVSKVVTLSRRLPKQAPNPKLEPIVSKDALKWPEFAKQSTLPPHSVIFSSFGADLETDFRVNVGMFKVAKESGKFDTAIIISAQEADVNETYQYLAVKAKIDEEIKKMGFKRTFILRPGALCGKREHSAGFTKEGVRRIKAAGKGPHYGDPIEAIDLARVVLYLSEQPIQKDGEYHMIEGIDLVNLADEKGLSS